MQVRETDNIRVFILYLIRDYVHHDIYSRVEEDVAVKVWGNYLLANVPIASEHPQWAEIERFLPK